MTLRETMMLTKPFIIALLVSLSFNFMFGYLSYSFYADKQVAVAALKTATDANKTLEESLAKKETACKATDSIMAEFQAEKQEIVGNKQADLGALNKLTIASTPKKKAVNEVKNAQQNNVAELDDLLPDGLRVLLHESCKRTGGDCSANAR
jgi:hypothetical protein